MEHEPELRTKLDQIFSKWKSMVKMEEFEESLYVDKHYPDEIRWDVCYKPVIFNMEKEVGELMEEYGWEFLNSGMELGSGQRDFSYIKETK